MTQASANEVVPLAEPQIAAASSATTQGVAEKDRVGYLDTYRGLACLMVYFYHTAVNIPLIGTHFPGYYGVHLFFVLSGYLMCGKFIPALNQGKSLPDLGKYLLRRFWRIYPAYIVCLFVFVGLRILSHVNPIAWQNILYHAGLVFNYVDKYDYYSINGVYWSLAVEIQFYIVLPIAVWLTLRLIPLSQNRLLWFALGFIAVGLISRFLESSLVNHVHPDAIAHVRFKWVTSHLDLFGFGILLRSLEYWAKQRNFKLSYRAAWVGMALSLAVLYAIALWSQAAGAWQESKNEWFIVFGSAVACIGFVGLMACTGLSPLKNSRFFRWRFLHWVGLISYSLYLYHTGVLFMFNKVFHPMTWGMSWEKMTLIAGVVCLPPTLLVAWLAYIGIEKPFLKMASGR